MIRFKRILLITPPHLNQGGYTPSPLSLLYLAGYIRQDKKIKIKVVDGAKDGEKSVIEALGLFKPDLIGITSHTASRHDAFRAAVLIKKLLPKSKVVLGGIHPTLMWKQILENYPQVDYIVRGEGEIILWELVHGKQIKKINGLCWKTKNNKAVINKDRQLVQDLDTIPFPAWDMISPQDYPPWGDGIYNNIDTTKVTRFSMIFTRGCMGRCTFCSSWMVWRGYRNRTAENVADEMEMLVKKYNAQHFAFYDDTLTGNKKEIINFCKEIIKRKLHVAIHATTRVDQVDYEILRWMKKAGFYEVAYGIESGSPEMLIRINKKTDIKKNYRAADLTHKAGMRVSALIMFGLPQETEKDRILTQALIKKMKPDRLGTVGVVWIFPGTALYEQAKNANLITDDYWLGKKPYYLYRGGIGGDPINRLAQIKDLILYSVSGSVLEAPLTTFFIRSERLLSKIKVKMKLAN